MTQKSAALALVAEISALLVSVDTAAFLMSKACLTAADKSMSSNCQVSLSISAQKKNDACLLVVVRQNIHQLDLFWLPYLLVHYLLTLLCNAICIV